jgi:hypothetical protein
MSDDNKPADALFQWRPTVPVTAEMHERLQLHAERLGITVEELVEQALANVGAN